MVPPATAAAEIERSVLATWAAYFAAFQRFDPTTADHFVAPLCRVSKGVPDTLATRAAIRQWLVTTWEGMAARRYGGATTASRTVTVLDARTVLLRAWGTRHELSGAPLEDFDVLYVLVRTDDRDRWRIAVIASVDPSGVT